MAFELPPAALLDANVLYPFHLRNLLVQLGVDLIFRPRWTERIHDEWVRNLGATGWASRERLSRTLGIMERVLPGANVPGWERRLSRVPVLPDPDDRHVIAAALEAPASVILTLNLRDFPAATLAPLGLVAEHPDSFLCRLLDADPEAVRASAEAAQANLSRSTPNFEGFLAALDRQGLGSFASALRRD